MLIKDPQRLERLLMFVWLFNTGSAGDRQFDWSTDPKESEKESFIGTALAQMIPGDRNKAIFDMLAASENASLARTMLSINRATAFCTLILAVGTIFLAWATWTVNDKADKKTNITEPPKALTAEDINKFDNTSVIRAVKKPEKSQLKK